MNVKEHHGKEVAAVYWPDTESEQGRCQRSGGDVMLEMSATHHGDRDEFWIVEFRKIGGEFVELTRHNLKYVETFSWV